MKKSNLSFWLFMVMVSFLSTHAIKGQVDYKSFKVGFETGIPSDWSQSPHTNATYFWKIDSGGISPSPSVPRTKNPRSAHGGTWNAIYYVQSLNNDVQKLITPKITGLKNYGVYPALKFWHSQGKKMLGEYSAVDQLRVYFKNHIDSAWSLLETFIPPTVVYFPNGTVDSTYWVDREIMLPTSRLTESCYFAFEGTAKWGYGVCIDDVRIEDTGNAVKKFKTSKVSQPLLTSVPKGSTYNPIIRVALSVTGNTGSSLLKSFSVKSQNSSNSDIQANGVRLYYTADSTFSPTNQLGRSRSFSSDTIIFSNLNKELTKGWSYLWITYDISASATAGNTIDALIPANGININDSIFPPADISPAGSRAIFETIFKDDFELDNGWSFTDEFQRSKPKGLGGSVGNADPTVAVSGFYVIGTDLDGLGSSKGDYEASIKDPYTATSPSIDLKYYKSMRLSFYRWLNVEHVDGASIDYSIDNGLTWNNYWVKDASVIAEGTWNQMVYDLPVYMERQPAFQFRFTLGSTDAFNNFSGWNIDDFVLTGEHIVKDVGVSEWISMSDDCNLSASASLTVRIKNYADAATPASFPIAISIDNGNTFTYDVVNSIIPKDGTYDFTFEKVPAISMASPDIYKVIVKTLLPGDQDVTNDALAHSVYSFPTYTVPYATNFDDGTVIWKAEGKTNEWEWGETTYPAPFSSPNVWKTQLNGEYYSEDSSWVVSPCYNFSGIDKPIVDFQLWSEVLENEAGTTLQYTTNGTLWQDVPKHSYSQWKWNWYNSDSIESLSNGIGWASTNEWIRARQFLPVANQSNVRFRFKFESTDSAYKAAGTAFDNFRLYNAPFDCGVDTITNLSTLTCQGNNPTLLNVQVTNYGVRDMVATDTLIIGVKVNNKPTVIDTFQLGTTLNVGVQKAFALHKPIDIDAGGYYKIKAFSIEKEANYYGGNNDTTWYGIWVKNKPVSGLKDTIRALDPDTVVIHAVDSTYFQYKWTLNGTVLSNTSATLPIIGLGVGKYYVEITNTISGCKTLDSVVVKMRLSDLAIQSISSPINHCDYGPNFNPIISIKNMGPDTLQVGRVVTFKVKLDNLTEQTTSYVLTKALPNGAIEEWVLNAPLTMAPALHTLKISLSVIGDKNQLNDTVQSSFEIYEIPTIDLGADREVQDIKYQFDAGAGYSSYLWNIKDSTNRTLTITESGYYWVTITNSHGCSDTDTVHIRLRVHDLVLKQLIQPSSACTFPTSSSVIVKLKNMGSDTIIAGTAIILKYWINGTLSASENYVSSTMYPNDSVNYTYSTNVDFSGIGSRKLALSAIMPGDMRPANDTLSATIYTFGNPIVNLKNDVTLKALQYDIKAGPGFTSYNWQGQGESADSIYAVTQTHFESSNKYSVTVTDVNGCKASDTVKVILQIADLALTSVILDNPVCVTSEPKYLKVKVKNTGNLNLTGVELAIRYSINGGTTESESFVYTADTGDTVTLDMKNEMIFGSYGISKVGISIFMLGDLRYSNDTDTSFVTVLEGPKINFVDAVNDTIKADWPYTLSPNTNISYTYSWNTGDTTPTIPIIANNYYSVTVTSGNGCFASKGVWLEKRLFDVTISGITLSSACEFPKQQKVGVIVANAGNMTLNDSITVGYQFSGGAEMRKKIKLINSVPKHQDTIMFDETLDLSTIGSYPFRAFIDTSMYNELPLTGTDEYSSVVYNWGYPVVDFGYDTLRSALPAILNPGAFASYLWLPGNESSATLSVTSQGLYSVEVIDNNGCKATKTIYVVDATPVLIAGGGGSLTIYPNPASDIAYIDFNLNKSEDVRIEFISSSGQIVIQKEQRMEGHQRIEVSEVQSISRGIYQILIRGEKWQITKKIVLQ